MTIFSDRFHSREFETVIIRATFEAQIGHNFLLSF